MARRGRRRKGHKGSKAIPLAMLAPLAPGISRILTYPQDLRHAVPDAVFLDTLAFDRATGKVNTTILTRQIGLVILGVVAHKIAGKTGINKGMKKLTMGYLQF